MSNLLNGITAKIQDPRGAFFSVFHYIGWVMSKMVGKAFFHLTSKGSKKVLNIKNDKVVFISSHGSGLDPFLAGSCLPFSYVWKVKGFRYMTAKKFITARPYGFLLWLFGAYSIKKNKNPETSLKKTYALLERGHNIFMFPTGRREEVFDPEKARPGIGYIAKRYDPVIVPLFIRNNYKINFSDYFKRKRKIEIYFGDPFKASENFDLNTDPAGLAKKITGRTPKN